MDIILLEIRCKQPTNKRREGVTPFIWFFRFRCGIFLSTSTLTFVYICQNPSEGCGFEEVLRWWITLTPWSNTLTGLMGDYSSSCIIPICPPCLWRQDRFRDWPRFRRKFLGKVGQSLWRLRECAKVCDSQIARPLPPSQDPGCSAHTYSLKQFLKNVKQSEYKQSEGRVSLLAQKPQRGLKKIKVGSKMIYDSRCHSLLFLWQKQLSIAAWPGILLPEKRMAGDFWRNWWPSYTQLEVICRVYWKICLRTAGCHWVISVANEFGRHACRPLAGNLAGTIGHWK